MGQGIMVKTLSETKSLSKAAEAAAVAVKATAWPRPPFPGASRRQLEFSSD